MNCFVLGASQKQPATAENSLLLEGDPAAITSMTDGEPAAIASVTVTIQEWVAIELSPSDNPEGRMHAVDTASLFPHTARPVRGSSRTMKSEPPIASTSNRPHRHPHQLQGRVTGLLLVLAIGGDGDSDFIVLELPCTGRAVCGRYQQHA